MERMDSSLAAPFLGGRAKAAPPSPLAVYMGGGGGGRAAISKPWRLPLPPVTHLPPPRLRLAKPCRSTAAPPPPCRRAAAGAISLNLSFPLAGSRRRRRLPSRTCVERGGAVRSALVIGDLDHVEYDYIITLQASARNLQVVCRCKLSPLTRCLDELIDGSW